MELHPTNDVVFVFGSNLAGRHGAGSALHARLNYGAEYGVGLGPTGSAYAIPTKDQRFHTLPLNRIAGHVKTFIEYATRYPHTRFRVVAIGCGLAGYMPEEIGPMFADAPPNCDLPPEFQPYRRGYAEGRAV